MMCKIFIHSPKRLRLQVLGIGGEGGNLLWGHIQGPPPSPGLVAPSPRKAWEGQQGLQ